MSPGDVVARSNLPLFFLHLKFKFSDTVTYSLSYGPVVAKVLKQVYQKNNGEIRAC
jgi:hypothetical protein